MGGKNITQLAGFERLVNLEVLWVHDNQLRAINCLEHNTRIKQLYAHNNRLCTLRGSITQLKFLTHLDISHNQLKRLDKVTATLQKLRFLQELNLQVSPTALTATQVTDFLVVGARTLIGWRHTYTTVAD